MKRRLARLTTWLVGAYGVLLAALASTRFGAGDVHPLVFAAHSLLLYAFLPLPLVLLASVLLRRTSFLALFVAGLLGWCGLWGELLWPREPPIVTGKQLVVLCYNALGYNLDATDAVAVVRDSNADLVALQELNPEASAALERELGSVYPYRWLEPRVGVTGGGILSKYPLTRATPDSLPGNWVGAPMIAVVDVEGTSLTFARFHALAGPASLREREQQARQLATLAQFRRRPLIVAGDLNATDQNDAYDIVAAQLRDSWREVGRGFGHTFPGEPTAARGGSRPTLLGVAVPLWLVRIDYVFHSDELRAANARLSAYPGKSDHRGVVATLALR